MRSQASYENGLLRSREAKRRRTGTCEDCGTETRYNGRTAPVSTLCLPCASARSAAAKIGTGSAQSRVLAFIGEGERRFVEIMRGCGMTHGHTSVCLHRMRRHGLLERPRRGVYRKASA